MTQELLPFYLVEFSFNRKEFWGLNHQPIVEHFILILEQPENYNFSNNMVTWKIMPYKPAEIENGALTL